MYTPGTLMREDYRHVWMVYMGTGVIHGISCEILCWFAYQGNFGYYGKPRDALAEYEINIETYTALSRYLYCLQQLHGRGITLNSTTALPV